MSLRTLQFVIWGEAVTKGSTKAFAVFKKRADGTKEFRGTRVTEDNARSRPWQSIVRDAARQAIGGTEIPFPDGGPVAVQLIIWLPAPKSLPKRRASAPTGYRYDIDKVARGILDALTGVAWSDDGQVAYLRVWKAYATPGTMPHVDVTAEAVPLERWPWCLSVAPGASTGPARSTAADYTPSLFEEVDDAVATVE